MRNLSFWLHGAILLGLLLPAFLLLEAQAPPEGSFQKLSPRLTYSLSAASEEKVTVLIQLRPEISFPSFLDDHGMADRLLHYYAPTQVLLLSLSPEELKEKILPDGRVLFADLQHLPPSEERFLSSFDWTVNRVNTIRSQYPGLDGAGLTVSIKENRPDSVDIDLLGRYLPSGLGARGVSTHSTTMATIIAGAGNSFHNSLGPAWRARYTSSSFFNLFPDPEAHFRSTNAWVQNHSYGVEIENYYGAEAQAYDLQVSEQPGLLHVFSAGNRGENSSNTGPYAGVPGFANLSGNFKMAKNVLTAGAVDSFLNIESRSSRGPAFDGRVKPELVAFGEDGSSGAAAITSGVALLLQQAYQQRHNGQLPPAALLRAVLLNSAQDLGTPGPDYTYGYGNVLADRAVATLQENRVLSGMAAQGDSLDFELTIPAGARHLKLTLAWTDPPGPINGSRALVNDLDLTLVQKSTGLRWLPWVLNPFAHADSLALPARRGRDSLNNQEQVTLDDPGQGTYTLRIHARDLGQGPQAFFVAYEFDTPLLSPFAWHFPGAADPVTAGQLVPLKWSFALNDSAAGEISYRYSGSETWLPVASEVDLAAGSWRWQAPDTLAEVQLRMLLNSSGTAYLSDSFILSPLLATGIGFDCEADYLFSWQKEKAAVAYRVYYPDSAYLHPVLSTTDTLVVLPKALYPLPYLAVSPVAASGAEGMRSIAINRDFQQAGCYIRSFLATLEGDQVRLSLRLGTLYQVEKVFFEKLRGAGFTPLAEVQPGSEVQLEKQDASPAQGTNTYRARVRLTDGKEYLSDTASVLYVKAGDYLIGPNPAEIDGDLIVFRQGTDPVRLQLFDSLGRLVLVQELIAEYSPVSLFNLNRGMYAYQLLEGGKPVKQGKLVIW